MTAGFKSFVSFCMFVCVFVCVCVCVPAEAAGESLNAVRTYDQCCHLPTQLLHCIPCYRKLPLRGSCVSVSASVSASE